MGYIESYFGSFLLYSTVICFCTLLAKWAERKNYNIRIIWLMIIILSIFEGIRGESVVVDTHNYYNNLIYPLINGSTPNIAIETGFVYLAKIVLFVSNDSPKVFFLVIALIINSFIILRLLDFKGFIDFPYYVFIFLATYMVQTMNTLAQWVAISIVFYFSRYLIRGKWWKFLIASCIAFEIHNSSIVAVIVFFVFYLFDKTFSRGIRKFFLMFPIVLGGLFVASYAYSYLLYSKYYYLIESVNANVGLLIPAKLSLVLFVIFLLKKKSNNLAFNETWKEHNYFAIITVFSLLSLALSFTGYYFIWVGRIAYMFALWELLLFSLHSNKQLGFKFGKILYVLLVLYNYMSLMILNSTSQLPYVL